MVRPPSFDMNGIKSGLWSKEEDDTLRAFVDKHGFRNWQRLPFLAGLARSGKSCRLRWMNYLQPGLKKGNFSKEEVDLIIRLHNQIGNRWSAIAEKLPGRTDNDIKNHWHAHIKKRSKRSRLMVHEEQSFVIKKSGHQEQTSAPNDVVFAQDSCAENINVDTFFSWEEEFSDLGLWHSATPTSFSDSSSYDDHTSLSQLNLDIPPEEFGDLGLWHNATPTFSDSSNGGISYDDLPRFSEEEFSDLGPPFSNSSDGGITPSDSILKNQREVNYFNHLERIWYFGDDDL